MNFYNTDWIYDLETYPNIFSFAAVYANGNGYRVYEVSDRKNDTQEILGFLRNLMKNKQRMVGFNNLAFDYPIIHYIIEKAIACKFIGEDLTLDAKELYKEAQKLINSMKSDNPNSGIRDKDIHIKQVDLFKVHHFDNKARQTSLKMLEFNMRSKNIEDLPFPVGKILSPSEIDTLLTYNKHDVMQTLKFYHYSYDNLSLRLELAEKFGFDCTNFNDTKIGKHLFISSLEEESPGCCYEVTQRGRKIRQTKREKIVIANCLFPYIKFDRPEFQAIHEWFARQVITETKGVFSDLEEHQLGDVAKYAEMVVKRKKVNDPEDKKNKRYIPTEDHIRELKEEHPMGWMEEKELKSPKGAKSYYWCWNIAETLNVVINGFRYDYGVGGIHGAKQGINRTQGDRLVKTLDVASYYPNMAIANEIFPAHLGKTFCKVYKDLYEERKSHAKGTGANAALKLALNGTYGETNNEFSPLYDPAYTMSITIGGQLSLCMLMEKLIDYCDAEIVMCNTDGFEYIVHKDNVEEANKWVVWWEELTGLVMEGDDYEVMFVRDVNNYISVTTHGKVKLKGAYEYMDYTKLGWHKNHSAMVVAMAAEAHLVKGINYKDFIMQHKNEWDFMLRTKVPRSSRLVMVDDFGIDLPLQNICRYYPSQQGGKLVKIMPPLVDGGEERRLSIDKEWNVTPCNDMDNFKWGIDYEYYFEQTKKLIEIFEESL